MKRLLIAGVVLLVSASALAEDCDNAISQTEMNMCSADQYDKADKNSTRHGRRHSSAPRHNSVTY